MRLPYFIATHFNYHTHDGRKRRQTGIKIATFGIALGLTIMIVSICVLSGFKQEVSSQVSGFGSHIQIFDYGSGYSFEKKPITLDQSTYQIIKAIPEVERIDLVATKTGVIKTDDNFKGVVFKGVGNHYNWDFYKKNLTEGNVIDYSNPSNKNKVLISQSLSKLLKIGISDYIYAYFFQNKIRVRKLKVAGIYATTFSEFDKLFVMCDIEQIQRLNLWDSTMVSVAEITLRDFKSIDKTTPLINSIVSNKFDKNQLLYQTQSIKEIYPQIFGWLDMLDINVYIIIILMIAVAGFNMVAGILILMLDKRQTIGIFKALGMPNSDIRKTFVFWAMFFVLRGMLWGNIIGISMIAIQHFTHIIPLNPEFYYTNFVPVNLSIWLILLLNLGVIVFSLLILLIPSHIITKISPAKSIKFD